MKDTERIGLTNEFQTVKFANTLEHLRELKREKSDVFGDSDLSVKDLLNKFFPLDQYSGHKGARNLEHLFTEPTLKGELCRLRKQTYHELLFDYYSGW